MQTLGQKLAEKRSELNLSFEAISSFIKIKPIFLQALELDNREFFESDTYYFGFLKQYSKFLNVKIEHIGSISNFRKPALEVCIPNYDSFRPTPIMLIMALIFCSVLYKISEQTFNIKPSKTLEQKLASNRNSLVKLSKNP
jgi:hypothetical protein